MEDPEEVVIPATIPKNSSTEGKAVEDPPGWAAPVNRARHLEWWDHPEYQQQTQHQQRTQPQHQSQPISDIESSQIPQEQAQTLHRYDDYLKANGNDENNANDDDTFSWVPPPPVGASNRSPDGWALTFRTLEAKRIFELAVPQRSWSVDSDKNDKPLHSEQTVITDFTHNSWMMERPPAETEESMEKAPRSQSQVEGEIVEEEVVDEETYHSGTVEEVIDEEEIIEEEIIVEDDDDDDDNDDEEDDIEEIVDEEILEQVMVASASESYTVSTFSSQSKPQHPPSSNRSQPTMPVRSSSPSSFVPLPPKSEKAAKPPPRRRGDPKSTKGAKTKTTKMAPPRKKIAQRAPDSVASRTHHSVPTPSKKKPISQSSSSSSSSRRPIDDEVTEDSGSTQILYIRDPHDLQEIVEKCFNGNVRIEDEVPTRAAREEDDYCAPTQFQLGLMIVLIILISMAIVVGLMVYFK